MLYCSNFPFSVCSLRPTDTLRHNLSPSQVFGSASAKTQPPSRTWLLPQAVEPCAAHRPHRPDRVALHTSACQGLVASCARGR